MKKIYGFFSIALVLVSTFFLAFDAPNPQFIDLANVKNISLIGNNLGSRMINYDYFETELQLRYPSREITVRNMCDGGDTPGFRPHSSRFTPWAFPGAEAFQTEFANPSESEGHYDSPDQWLTKLNTDLVIGFFGFNESFNGPVGIPTFKKELSAFIDHTLAQQYNGNSAPKLVLVSPIAYENLSTKMDVPSGDSENKNLTLYAAALKEVCLLKKIKFIDVFTASKSWYSSSSEDLTIDGSQLNKAGYKFLGEYLNDQIFGPKKRESSHYSMVYDAVAEKNWFWHNDYKIPNGVHVYGRRFNPFGQDNYPAEIEKIRQMTVIRDKAIWLASQDGKAMDLASEDLKTPVLPEVKTNFDPGKNGNLRYLYGDEAVASISTPAGYKVELFASEKEFVDMANPVQMTFDNKGRLWVATMPSYPHYKPGDSKPNDKIIILEDTNNDGKADKQTVFADKLHVPVGFEITHDGVYVSQGTNLMVLKDTNGDDVADTREVVLSGFDDHDTHHEISAFVADEMGGIYMLEGIFLHTNVETSYGPVRATNGGLYRYDVNRKKLERTAQIAIPNPWGLAFDHYGQPIFAETSGPDVRWLLPSTILPRYGQSNPKAKNIIEAAQKVRPTSGLEFVSSRHFPDEVQGDLLINNTIGFLGMKQHQMIEEGTGFVSKFRQDLFQSTDKNFRPVDMEFAPDGSLYFIDWHNILIGHMQHNARDPLRDHVHGRVYRMTYNGKPLITPAKVAGASIPQLLANLTLPEYRTRYRTRRELRSKPASEVLPQINQWIQNLDPKDPQYEHHMLEGLWVSAGLNKVDVVLLKKLLAAKDYKVRAAAVGVLRYQGQRVPDQESLLTKAVTDAHGRVRMEAIAAATWLKKDMGNRILTEALKKPMDEWIKDPFEVGLAHLNGRNAKKEKELYSTTNIKGKDFESFTLGRTLYAKEGNCATCHQNDGKGLPASGFPPLAGTNWVNGSKERLIKIVLNGIMGPIEVNGKEYPGQVPMTPYGGMLKDKEIAGILTYVRNSFGNQSSVVTEEEVKKVRQDTKSKKGFYSPSELLNIQPLEK